VLCHFCPIFLCVQSNGKQTRGFFAQQKYASACLVGQMKLPNEPNQYLNMENKDWKGWMRRLGVAGFLFFLIKGLVWLAIFWGAWEAGCN
jgi:hypothetical protein